MGSKKERHKARKAVKENIAAKEAIRKKPWIVAAVLLLFFLIPIAAGIAASYLENNSLSLNAYQTDRVQSEQPQMTFNATVQVEPASIQPEIKGDVVTYYHNDHLGTPLFMSDEDGNIVWCRQQTPFGETTYLRESMTENLRLPGQYWDGEKNSSYNYMRDNYYSNWGRYGQPDPIGQKGGVNVYNYGQANPVKNIDPSGQSILEGALDGLESLPETVETLLSLAKAAVASVGGAVVMAPPKTDCKKPCQPCKPYPAGTIGYIGPHTTHSHYPISPGQPHLNLWQVNQRPSDCKCFWNDLKEGAPMPPLPGWVNCNSGFPPLSP